MTTKEIYYYSNAAAMNYGFKIAKNLNNEEIKFTGTAPENNPSCYDWDDKKIVGVFDSKSLTIINNMSPSSNDTKNFNRENLEKQINLMYKDKTPEKILNDSFQMTRQKLINEKNENKQKIMDKISVMRYIYNCSNLNTSSKLKN